MSLIDGERHCIYDHAPESHMGLGIIRQDPLIDNRPPQ